jgi:DNA-binding response OmpR family regulator
LRQVALNLISNAVRFTEHGAITVEICVTGEAVTVMVSDTGPGVPLADQQKIFDEFRMSERTADRAYGGLGLGLTICKQLIEQHGGTIGVRSSGEEDAGATFFFTLSLILPDDGGRRTKDGDAEGGRQKAEELNSQSHFTTYPRRVVFLTEGEHSGGPLSTALRELGFDAQVQRIDSGVDWLPVLSTAAPGVLVLDEHLATSRGWEIIRLLKGHPRLAHLPLLMYSLDSSHDNGTLLALDYLLKPLDIEQLVTALERQRDYHDRPPDDRTILVVDDNPDILAMHTRLIKQQMPECRLVQARNGVEALAIMSEQRPNLVLLDLMMPEMDGFHVLEAMREQESLVDVPVVVLTARLLTEDDMTRLNAGVAAILSKGLFGTDEILARIESTLAHERRLGLASQQIVRRAVAFIHTHYDEPMTRDQIATHVGFSPDHLTACFRQEMGVTPISYLNRYRISRARTLLTESTRSVTDITVAVGFSDVANFSRAFRREVGVSPKAYRRDRQQ